MYDCLGSTLKDDRGEWRRSHLRLAIIQNVPYPVLHSHDYCAAHSILTSCCFTTSTSAKEKKYKRQWKVNYLSLCWTPNLFVISISAFSGLLVGSLFWKGVSAKLRNPHRRSKKEVWVTPCLLLETWIEPRWMVKYQKKQCYNFHAYCPPSKLEGRKGRQMVGSTRSIQIVRCVKLVDHRRLSFSWETFPLKHSTHFSTLFCFPLKDQAKQNLFIE